MAQSKEWADSSKYNLFMGRWSQRIATKFLTWFREKFDVENKSWIDVGCGTGALSFEITELMKPIKVVGVDPSSKYLPNSMDEKLIFSIGSGSDLPFATEFHVVVSGLALNFMGNFDESIQEMKRVLLPGGVIGLYVWDYSDKMEFLRYFWDVVTELDSDAKNKDEGQLFPICNHIALEKLFSNNGLVDLHITQLDVVTHFSSFDDYWTPFLGGQGPAGVYLNSISSDHLVEIENRLREVLPIEPDGSISLVARALGIIGQKPSV